MILLMNSLRLGLKLSLLGPLLLLVLLLGAMPDGSEGLTCFECSGLGCQTKARACGSHSGHDTFCSFQPGDVSKSCHYFSQGERRGCWRNSQSVETCYCKHENFCNGENGIRTVQIPTTPPPPTTTTTLGPGAPGKVGEGQGSSGGTGSAAELKCYNCPAPGDCEKQVNCTGGVCSKMVDEDGDIVQKPCIPTRDLDEKEMVRKSQTRAGLRSASVTKASAILVEIPLEILLVILLLLLTTTVYSHDTSDTWGWHSRCLRRRRVRSSVQLKYRSIQIDRTVIM